MECISSGSVCDRLPLLSAKYPWLLSQSLEDTEHVINDQFFYTINDELPQIPELLGKRIHGSFHGWVILSDHPHNSKWSLWNPVTSKIICLPTLILKDGDYGSIRQGCLSAAPDDPSSILLLTRSNKSTFVYYRLDSKRKKFRWTEMSYAKQLRKLSFDGELLHSLTCCNGKVYGLSTDGSFTSLVIHIDIMITDKKVAITLMMFGPCPFPSQCPGKPSYRCCGALVQYLKGYCTELFCIIIYFEEETKKTPANVYLFKIDMACIKWDGLEGLKDWEIINDNFEELDLEDMLKSNDLWEEMDDLKDGIFCLDLACDHSVSYSRVISSELGGYIHIRCKMGETIYSYYVNDNTISPWSIPSRMLPTSDASMWECRLEDDHGEAKCVDDSKSERKNNDEILLTSGTDDGVDFNESHLLNIPSALLESVMEHCVGVEYMNFRATCKRCYLATPLIKWSNKRSIKRLQTYSVVSPWLMVVDKKRDMITFIDPMFGDNYFIKKPQISIVQDKIFCSCFGWLLFENDLSCYVLYNPFTNDLRKLPAESRDRFKSLSFSAPPTSAKCIVVGFKTAEHWHAHIHFVNREPVWYTLNLYPDPYTICSSIFDGRDLYALGKEGDLIVFNNLGQPDHLRKLVEVEAPKSCSSSTKKYLTKCDQQLLLVSVGEFGEHVEVFKHNASKQEWEKVDGVGKHMIYICDATCLCIEAKMPQMENKIFFPQLHAMNRKIVFYSLDTCMYHTFDGEDIQEQASGFFGNTFHFFSHAWIEPNWS
ncbi:hypothetical protein CTI12_AA382280 [Artemisia annua]|uniref:KIB1-4 beta-propeller domain-containing protein n=1 Tax=Artemisia annua TaxID=35608 RepID=A0A2U1MD46_ARTAN|nr:hypothetical protein CTI12_AA382280 [Artemisia annua]